MAYILVEGKKTSKIHSLTDGNKCFREDRWKIGSQVGREWTYKKVLLSKGKQEYSRQRDSR